MHAQRVAILGITALLLTVTLPGHMFLPDVGRMVMLPSGILVSASLVHQGTMIRAWRFLLNVTYLSDSATLQHEGRKPC